MSIALQELSQPATGTGGGGGAVDSVFGRTGDVVAGAGDYDSDQVDNLSGVAGATVSDALDQLDTDLGTAETAILERVTGPASAAENKVPRWDGTTGKLLKDSSVGIDDGGNLYVTGTLSVAGNISVAGNVNGVDVSALNTTVSAKADKAWTVNRQTGTSYTLQNSDSSVMVTTENAGAFTLTVPSTLADGSYPITVLNGAGQLTVAGSGITVQPPIGLTLKSRTGGTGVARLTVEVFTVNSVKLAQLVGDVAAS